MPTPNNDVAFYGIFFDKINNALESYWFDTATDVMEAIAPAMKSMLILYVMLWGWSMMRGIIQEPLMDGIQRALKIAIISGIALQMGQYSEYIANFLWNAPDELAAIVAGGKTDVQYLDVLISHFYDMFQRFNDNAQANSSFGIPDLTMLLTGILVMGAGTALSAYAAYLFVLSKIAIAVLIGIGPIFVALLLFDATKRFFEQWLAQALTYLFMVVLAAATTRLIVTILDSYLTASMNTESSLISVIIAVPAIGIALIGILVLMQVNGIASALGGGASIGTLGAPGAIARGIPGAANALRPSNLQKSAQGVKQGIKADYQATKGAVNAVGRAPKAFYRQIVTARKNRVTKAE